jgi:ubiquinone/menaquinone biosynthesis C-methylase UbiE
LEPDRKRVRQIRRNHPSVKVMLAVVEFLPFRQLLFDKIYLKRSFHHFTDQEAGLKEARRVLKAEGILVIQEVSPERQWKLIQLPERWLRRAHVNFLSLNDSEVKLEREVIIIISRDVFETRSCRILSCGKQKTDQTLPSRFQEFNSSSPSADCFW